MTKLEDSKLFFDKGTIGKLKNPKIKTETKLYFIVRYIEVKHQLATQLDYWDSLLDPWPENEKIFYKLWLWIAYAEWEGLTSPIKEFDLVYGVDKRKELEYYLKEKDSESDELDSFYSFEGEASDILLEWGLINLNSNFE